MMRSDLGPRASAEGDAVEQCPVGLAGVKEGADPVVGVTPMSA